MNVTSRDSNTLSSLTEMFTPDDLSMIIGICLPEPVAVIDPTGGKLVAGNRKLEEFLGIGLKAGAAQEIRLEDHVHPDDRGLMRTWLTTDLSATNGTFDLRFRDGGGSDVIVEVFLSSFRWRRREFLLAILRPIVDQSAVERDLKEKIAEQRKKTLEAVKSSLLVYQFTEKIKKTPILTTNLLSTESEGQLFERAARILTGEGLNYKDVTFLLMNDNSLEVCHSTKPFSRRLYSIYEETKYSQFLRESRAGGKPLEKDREILVPLRSRGTFLGLIEVTMHTRERIFFDELNLVSEWQKDALLTIGDMIALLLDNLRLYREVKRQSIIDPLTGVYNRHYFVNHLSNEINRCIRGGYPISLIFVDVDHFKQINDTYGHVLGDQILRGLGAIFKTNFREYDCVCRYGGDEFVVLLPEVGGEHAQKIAAELLQVVRQHDFSTMDQPGRRIPISISIGVSVLNKDLDENLFLRSADTALYKAKERGRNQMVFNSAEDFPKARDAAPSPVAQE